MVIIKKVRFLEGCYLLSTKESYNVNSVAFIDEDLANRLYERESVDFLEDDNYISDEVKKEDVSTLSLEDKNVKELQELASDNDITYSGLRKTELIEALSEVL